MANKFAFNPLSGNFDLVSDLSGYVPYTGATADVDLGDNSLTIGKDFSGGDPNVTKLHLIANPTMVGDGQSIDWCWATASATTARIRTSTVSSSADKLEFQTSEFSSLTTALSLGDSTSYFTGSVGFGVTSPLARLHSQSATEQLRVGFNASNYFSTTVGSTGITTFQGVGTATVPGFRFDNNISVGMNPTTLFSLDAVDATRAGFRFTSGTRSIYSVSFASDTNYLFSTGAQFRLGTADSASLEFFSNSTKRGEFLSNGNFVVDTDVLFVNATTDRVGVGTNAPSAKLHIADSATATIRVNAGTRNININSFAGDWNYQTSTGAPYVFGTQDNNILLLYTNNTEKVRITTSGNVGIGTNAPTVRLHIMAESEQVRTGFNASNYFSTTVASDGATTFNAVGSGAKFVFSDNIELTQTVTTEAVTSDTTVTIVINGTTYRLLAKA
jgi:hypothetical protein